MIEMDDHGLGSHHSAVAIEIDQRQAGKMSEPTANGLLVCRSDSESGNIFDSSPAVECRSSIKHSILEINRRGVVSGARVGARRTGRDQLLDCQFVLDDLQAGFAPCRV